MRRLKLSWFAGLCEWWADPADPADPAVPAGQPGRWLLSTSVITLGAPDPDDATAVLAELGQLHDRLPLALSAEALAAWIAPGNPGQTAALQLLAGVLGQADAPAGIGAGAGTVRGQQQGREQHTARNPEAPYVGTLF